MKLTEKQIEAIAKECGFDITGRLVKFANMIYAATPNDHQIKECARYFDKGDIVEIQNQRGETLIRRLD